MHIDITEIVIAFTGLLAATVTGFLLPLLKAKLDAAAYAKTLLYTDVAVKAAEQTLGRGAGKEKLQYAERYLKEKNITLDMAAIEAAVRQYFGKETQFCETSSLGYLQAAELYGPPPGDVPAAPLTHSRERGKRDE